ncbi:MAG: response regulator transcription factor [Bacteroidales bacterium]|nr:response regulator transcription factor [Bacteroidales bacterium]MCF8387902.1 response regulator transcription factor [Bacteroidales bacterium]MCF8398808.1 response regulator transcription factor [Bacteroidales bacterium]
MIRILIVEDEEHMRLGLRDNLEFEDYEVDTAGDGEEALQKLNHNNYQLILLDVMLPKISGFDVCKKIRKQGINTPVIFLTAKSQEIDKVIGLETGGDDYVTKPFSLRELLARIKAILRREKIRSDPNRSGKSVEIGKLKVDFESYTASIGKEEVSLSVKEFQILEFLWNRKRATVKRSAILDHVWGDEYQPSSRTIDNFIVKLRQKIEEDPNHPRILITVHGMGYKLVMH